MKVIAHNFSNNMVTKETMMCPYMYEPPKRESRTDAITEQKYGICVSSTDTDVISIPGGWWHLDDTSSAFRPRGPNF
jgi:hypothetical protein